MLLLNALMALAPWLHNVPTNPLENMAGTAAGAAVLGVVAIFAGGVREELQRAFLLRRFEQHLGGAVVGVVVLSVAFGLGHIVQGWDAVVTTGLLGAFWAVLYLRRRSARGAARQPRRIQLARSPARGHLGGLTGSDRGQTGQTRVRPFQNLLTGSEISARPRRSRIH